MYENNTAESGPVRYSQVMTALFLMFENVQLMPVYTGRI